MKQPDSTTAMSANGPLRRYFSATFQALGVRDFRLFAIGQLISVSGTWMQKLAQAWLVLLLTDSGLILGVAAALQQLPTTLFTTYGGALADRYDRRRILLCTAAVGAVPALFLGLVLSLGTIQVWMVLAAALVQGCADAMEKPARLTLVNDLAPPEVLTNAVAINSVIQNAGKVFGPALAGVLIGGFGLASAFLLNAASYGAVIIALMMMRPRRSGSPVVGVARRGSVRATLRYVAERPPLAAALGLMFVAGLLASNWTVVIPLLIRDSFGGVATAVGFGFTAMGLGGIVGGIVLAGLLKPTSRGLVINGWTFALAFLILALCPWLNAAYAALFVVGTASVAFRATATSILQLGSDPSMRGRVVSLLVLCLAGTTPVGGPLIGYLAEIANARTACALGAVATAVAAAFATRYLRRHAEPADSAAVVTAADAPDRSVPAEN